MEPGKLLGVEAGTRTLASSDWPAVWPMIRAMGSRDSEFVAAERFRFLLADERWA